MTFEELVTAAKSRVHKKENNDLDDDIRQYINYVLSDLARIGVKALFLTEPKDPLIIEAVLNYVRAFYAMDQFHDAWMAAYNSTIGKIKLDPKYFEEATSADA